ncbi:hypothetical protein SPHINGO361_130152 [Sphingomonas sp. EC-HK361]|nr:hypothetical protein SPHINGO361_130152 [Sphingomonas sp. EC-HK361]
MMRAVAYDWSDAPAPTTIVVVMAIGRSVRNVVRHVGLGTLFLSALSARPTLIDTPVLTHPKPASLFRQLGEALMGGFREIGERRFNALYFGRVAPS